MLCARRRTTTSASLVRWTCTISLPLQPRQPGGTGVAMAARDDSRAVLAGMWTKWSFMGKDEGEPGRRNTVKFPFDLCGGCVCAARNKDNLNTVAGHLVCTYARAHTYAHKQAQRETHAHTLPLTWPGRIEPVFPELLSCCALPTRWSRPGIL